MGDDPRWSDNEEHNAYARKTVGTRLHRVRHSLTGGFNVMDGSPGSINSGRDVIGSLRYYAHLFTHKRFIKINT
jgi:hypothetical protein